jgi:hypothetical protein
MSARAFDRPLIAAAAALAFAAVASAQTPAPTTPAAPSKAPAKKATPVKTDASLERAVPGKAAPAAETSGTAQSANGPFTLQVLAPTVSVHAGAQASSRVIATLQQGARLESSERRGNAYRITLADGRTGWVFYTVGKTSANLSVDASKQLARTQPGQAGAEPATPAQPEPAPKSAPAPEALPDDRIVQERPMGRPLEPIIPEIDPRQVPPPSPLLANERVPVPDRWRILDQLGIVNNRLYDPYNPNTIKGDRPIFGEDWFLAFTGISDTLFEARRLPTGIGAQSTDRSQSNDQFGGPKQNTFAENLILTFSLLKGDTTFKPPEFEFRFVPVLNYNVSHIDEVRGLTIDPRVGTTRRDHFAAVQELFVDYEYNIASVRYDFDDVRVGIQPFISDFRGFLFQDQPVGIRFFGNRSSNLWQYNLGWFRRMEKDTNSGLNDISKPLRRDDVFVANLYRQDFWVPGFTLQGTIVYNDNRETAEEFLDNNGFQVRPAEIGDARPHKYRVLYVGANGDGHFGRWNLTASTYLAFGKDDRNPFSQQSADIESYFAAAELSRDFDWYRIRGSFLFSSGDKNPFDGKETGFDAILENPQFAGADTSFWIRQAVPLIGGGGVALSGRNAVLPSLRSSKDQGQSNFTNPGLTLLGIGADVDLTPRWRLIGNLNQLWFNNTSVLSVLRNAGEIDKNLGTDISFALQYRPFFTQNIVINASAAALIPGKGFKDLYGNEGGRPPYSILANILLTF